MKKIQFIYKEEPKYVVDSKEVIKIIDDKPHLLLRIKISGTNFPHRAKEPVVRIMYSKEKFAVSWFAKVSDDNKSLNAYFPVDTDISEWIEYGYGNVIHCKINEKFDPNKIYRLDREKMIDDTVIVTRKHLDLLNSAE